MHVLQQFLLKKGGQLLVPVCTITNLSMSDNGESRELEIHTCVSHSLFSACHLDTRYIHPSIQHIHVLFQAVNAINDETELYKYKCSMCVLRMRSVCSQFE